jgi:hypothetical protein
MKKIEIYALYILVIAHILYDWAIPFISTDYHALFASIWNLTLFGYIGIRLANDSINGRHEKYIRIRWTITAYFIYRTFINVVAFINGINIEGSWDRYKAITSNYIADVLIWSIILLNLLYITISHTLKCRKAKIT